MPKEIIRGTESLDASVIDQVEVRWSRETGDVQVVSKAVRDNGDRIAHDDPGIHYTDGMYVSLNRRGINDLIRHLRRARDQAFGRDE